MAHSDSVQITNQIHKKEDLNLEDNGVTKKEPGAFRTISEVADEIHVPQHVLRFWETRFPQLQPVKRSGGRRYYRVEDVVLLKYISELLYIQGYTIKGVQRLLTDDLLKTDQKENLDVKKDPSVPDTKDATEKQSDPDVTQENILQDSASDTQEELERLRKENLMLIDSLKGILVELQELRKIIADT